MKGIKIMFLLMLASIFIASMWNKVPVIKNSVHYALDNSIGLLLNWNKTFGMLVVVFLITLLTTLVQKYGTNQGELRKIRQEQKILQEEMKKYKNNPEKLVELNKKSFEFFPKTLDLTMRSALYTFVPLILLFRWFMDYFANDSFRFFGLLSWFWFYLIFSIVFSSFLRKLLKVD